MKKNILPLIIVAVLSSILSISGFYLVLKPQTDKSRKPELNLGAGRGYRNIAKPDVNLPVNNTPTNSGLSYKNQLPDFSKLVEKLKPTVVHISTTSGPGNPYLLRRYHGLRPPKGGGSLGTGIIIRKDGLIVTNYHVIRGASRIVVKTADGKKYPAFLKGRDERTDIALIKIKGSNLPVAVLGDSNKLPIGAWVVAIGNPFGLSYTVTAGIISAKNRKDLSIGRQGYWNLLQTDAAINPGNSGGPLINLNGEVIGINTLVDTRGPGIGYAIPANMIRKIIPHLAKYGQVARSYLGVTVVTLKRNDSRIRRSKHKTGAVVENLVPGGPAAKSGMLIGDIIFEFNKKPIKDSEDIAWEASIAGIGKKIKTKIIRDHKIIELNVLMVPHPGNRMAKVNIRNKNINNPPLGLFVKNVKGMGFKTKVMVMRIATNSVGQKHQIRKGDIILNIGNEPVTSVKDYYKILNKIPLGQKVMLLIDSPNATRWVVLPNK
jgi:serine protease Do